MKKKLENTKMEKKYLHLKNFTSLANELLLHKCRNNMKMQECKKYSIWIKKYTSQVDEFLLHPKSRKLKINKINFEKNAKVQVMSFCYINVETKMIFFFKSEKKTKSSYDFLIDT